MCGAGLAADGASDGEARRWAGRAPDAFPAAAAAFRVPVAWVRDPASVPFFFFSARVPGPQVRDRHVALARTVEQSPRRRRKRPSARPAASGAAAGGVQQPPATAGPQPVGRQIAQMRKDMRRDRVSIDGEVVAPDGGVRRTGVVSTREQKTKKRGRPISQDHHEAIAAALARRLLEAARADRGPCDAPGRPLAGLTEAGAVAHAAAVLIACTRTCSGGDAYAFASSASPPPSPERGPEGARPLSM